MDKRVWTVIYICFRFRRGTPRLDWSYYPIDASTAHIIRGFLSFYEAGFGELYLAKAKALADQITVMQEESGRIPTFWVDTPGDRSNFWFNCMFYSCDTLTRLAKYDTMRFE